MVRNPCARHRASPYRQAGRKSAIRRLRKQDAPLAAEFDAAKARADDLGG